MISISSDLILVFELLNQMKLMDMFNHQYYRNWEILLIQQEYKLIT